MNKYAKVPGRIRASFDRQTQRRMIDTFRRSGAPHCARGRQTDCPAHAASHACTRIGTGSQRRAQARLHGTQMCCTARPAHLLPTATAEDATAARQSSASTDASSVESSDAAPPKFTVFRKVQHNSRKGGVCAPRNGCSSRRQLDAGIDIRNKRCRPVDRARQELSVNYTASASRRRSRCW